MPFRNRASGSTADTLSEANLAYRARPLHRKGAVWSLNCLPLLRAAAHMRPIQRVRTGSALVPKWTARSPLLALAKAVKGERLRHGKKHAAARAADPGRYGGIQLRCPGTRPRRDPAFIQTLDQLDIEGDRCHERVAPGDGAGAPNW